MDMSQDHSSSSESNQKVPDQPASGSEQSPAMNRRGFLGKAAAVAGGAALTACAPGEQAAVGGESAGVITGPRVQWRMASSFPRSLDTLFGQTELIAERVSALTEGRFTIRTYPAGELVPGLEVMDAVQQGTIQSAQTVSYYFSGKNSAFVLDSTMPFGLTPRQQGAWLQEGGGKELIRELYSDFGIINFPGGNTGAQMGGWFKREVNTLGDINGLKMRIPGAGGDVMNRLGATVQVLAGGDIYPALERGAIDAAEWVGPYDDEKLGFNTAAPFYYYPGWWEPGPEMVFQVNRAAWDALPATYKEVFEYASRSVQASLVQKYDALNGPALQRLIASGTQLRRFSDAIMVAARNAATDIEQQAASANPAYRKIYDQWLDFREVSFRWFSTNELAYQTFVYGNRG